MTMTNPTTVAARLVAVRRPRLQSLAAPSRANAVRMLTIASAATASGDPMRGITTNGIANVATIAPSVFAARSLPALDPIWLGSSDARADEAGNVKPRTTVVGSTTRNTGQTIAWVDSRTLLGSSGPGWPMTWTRPAKARAATRTWATAIAPIGRPRR